MSNQRWNTGPLMTNLLSNFVPGGLPRPNRKCSRVGDSKRYTRCLLTGFSSSLLVCFCIPAQTIFDVAVQGEFKFLVCASVVPRQASGDLINDGLGELG